MRVLYQGRIGISKYWLFKREENRRTRKTTQMYHTASESNPLISGQPMYNNWHLSMWGEGGGSFNI